MADALGLNHGDLSPSERRLGTCCTLSASPPSPCLQPPCPSRAITPREPPALRRAWVLHPQRQGTAVGRQPGSLQSLRLAGKREGVKNPTWSYAAPQDAGRGGSRLEEQGTGRGNREISCDEATARGMWDTTFRDTTSLPRPAGQASEAQIIAGTQQSPRPSSPEGTASPTAAPGARSHPHPSQGGPVRPSPASLPHLGLPAEPPSRHPRASERSSACVRSAPGGGPRTSCSHSSPARQSCSPKAALLQLTT